MKKRIQLYSADPYWFLGRHYVIIVLNNWIPSLKDLSSAHKLMKIEQHVIICHTRGRETTDLTARISETIIINAGLCHIFLQHTSASLMICENYDPQVREDLENFFLRLVPDGDPLFQHTIEGKDDMPAHIRTILTRTDLTVPIQNEKLTLGTWQGIYLYEHRYQGQARNILLTFLGTQ